MFVFTVCHVTQALVLLKKWQAHQMNVEGPNRGIPLREVVSCFCIRTRTVASATHKIRSQREARTCLIWIRPCLMPIRNTATTCACQSSDCPCAVKFALSISVFTMRAALEILPIAPQIHCARACDLALRARLTS